MTTASDWEEMSQAEDTSAVADMENTCNSLELAVEQCCQRLMKMAQNVHSDLDLAFTLDPQAVSDIEQRLLKLYHLPNFAQDASMSFHKNVGKQIVLSNNQQTARKTHEELVGGIVMASEPMDTDMLYQVEIEQITTHYNGTFLGVTNKHPDDISLPPSFYPAPYQNEAMCIGPHGVQLFGRFVRGNWPVLDNLTEGTKVGLAVRKDRTLHLYVDGRNRGVVALDIPQPCFFMIELYSRCLQVTALPIIPVPLTLQDGSDKL